MRLRSVLARALALAALGAPAEAWTPSLLESMCRDARRLLPASLRTLMVERDALVREQMRTMEPADPLASLPAQTRAVDVLFRSRRVGEGIVALAVLARPVAELADPVLVGGSAPPAVVREYYAFLELSRPKLPVVLTDPRDLRLSTADLPKYWLRVQDRSAEDLAVIVAEMTRGGRVVGHREIDFRSPVFGVGSLAYSRAVTAIAATWLAVWREAQGDATRMLAPAQIIPQDRGPARGSNQ